MLSRKFLYGLSVSAHEEKKIVVELVGGPGHGDDEKRVTIDAAEDIFRAFPYSYAVSSERNHFSLLKRRCDAAGLGVVGDDDGSSDDSSSESGEGSGDDGIGKEYSVGLRPSAKTSMNPPGAGWEKHTKGFGSRLLAKMGFKE